MRHQSFGQSFTSLVRALTIASLSIFAISTTINQPSYAQGATFFCSKNNGVPVTYARTQDGKKVPIIRWNNNSYFPPPWTSQRRCQDVSRRFQINYDNGTLRVIKTAKFRGESVVCAAKSEDSPCTNTSLLFTLKRGSNANIIVRRLFERRGLAAGTTLNESSSDSITINFEAFLRSAKDESNQ